MKRYYLFSFNYFPYLLIVLGRKGCPAAKALAWDSALVLCSATDFLYDLEQIMGRVRSSKKEFTKASMLSRELLTQNNWFYVGEMPGAWIIKFTSHMSKQEVGPKPRPTKGVRCLTPGCSEVPSSAWNSQLQTLS